MSESSVGPFLDAIAKLPAFNGIAFRGVEAGAVEPPPLGVAAGVLATSRDPRVGTENFTATLMLVTLHRTGRDVSEFSEHPEDAEVVVRPGSVWQRLIELEVPGVPGRFVVLEELDPTGSTPTPTPTEWGATLAELRARITRMVQLSAAAAPLTVTSPGKFVGPWPAQVPDGS